jgi:lipoprotein NlpI
LRPADVIAAADAAGLSGERLTAARFYAHYYVGLYYEGEGDAKRAREYVALAAGKYAVPGYMGDVAKIHLTTMAGR